MYSASLHPPPPLSHLKGSTLLVIFDEAMLVKGGGGGVDEVGPPLLQPGVSFYLVWVNSVQLGFPQHADVQIGVALMGKRGGGARRG